MVDQVEAKNVELMLQQNDVEQETRASNNNKDDVDDDNNAESNSNSNNKATIKQSKNVNIMPKTEQAILDGMANQPITYTKYVGVQGTCILLLIMVLIGFYIYGFYEYAGFTCGMIYLW